LQSQIRFARLMAFYCHGRTSADAASPSRRGEDILERGRRSCQVAGARGKATSGIVIAIAERTNAAQSHCTMTTRHLFAKRPEEYLVGGDDHFSFIRRGIAACDIIDFDIQNTYWHTPQDTLDKVDARSLAIVGHVFLETVPELEKKSL
jgi:Peptidase family M28